MTAHLYQIGQAPDFLADLDRIDQEHSDEKEQCYTCASRCATFGYNNKREHLDVLNTIWQLRQKGVELTPQRIACLESEIASLNATMQGQLDREEHAWAIDTGGRKSSVIQALRLATVQPCPAAPPRTLEDGHYR